MWLFEVSVFDKKSKGKRISALERKVSKLRDASTLWTDDPDPLPVAKVLSALLKELGYEATEYGLKKKEKK